MEIKKDMIFSVKFEGQTEDEREYYFVVRERSKGIYLTCKTDYMTRDEDPSFPDLWLISEPYFNKLVESGEIRVETI